MKNTYINHIAEDTIDGRVHLSSEPGYVMTDGDKFYSRWLGIAINTPKPNLYTITDAEYAAILQAQSEAEIE